MSGKAVTAAEIAVVADVEAHGLDQRLLRIQLFKIDLCRRSK